MRGGKVSELYLAPRQRRRGVLWLPSFLVITSCLLALLPVRRSHCQCSGWQFNTVSGGDVLRCHNRCRARQSRERIFYFGLFSASLQEVTALFLWRAKVGDMGPFIDANDGLTTDMGNQIHHFIYFMSRCHSILYVWVSSLAEYVHAYIFLSTH